MAPGVRGTGGRLGVLRLQGGLHLVWARSVAPQALSHQVVTFGDEVTVPHGAVVVGEQDATDVVAQWDGAALP